MVAAQRPPDNASLVTLSNAALERVKALRFLLDREDAIADEYLIRDSRDHAQRVTAAC